MKIVCRFKYSSWILVLFSAYIGLQNMQAHPSPLHADPDRIATGFEFRGSPAVRVGDRVQIGPFDAGGMVEVRNEERFHQEALPNHNWRGFAFACFSRDLYGGEFFRASITGGYEHESAHPTGGLGSDGGSAHEAIYDGIYRNINLNSLMVRLAGEAGRRCALRLSADYQYYFLGRNTPELPGDELGSSHGLSGGVELSLPVADGMKVFVSAFGRRIFQGPDDETGEVYVESGGEVRKSTVSYPLINGVSTVSARCGLSAENLVPHGTVSLCFGILHGNIFGFVDSRERRTVYSIGVEIAR